ncbi:unnamed protein product [Paramecium pentaurelia]|uniref:Uncharacterized protein n=1 Tax=Paramecium pentaurelia TaxID=43138 RepID=A0A8S1SLD9_9CILI|nr:unnamed protein product [Paramecium pentaurelia]
MEAIMKKLGNGELFGKIIYQMLEVYMMRMDQSKEVGQILDLNTGMNVKQLMLDLTKMGKKLVNGIFYLKTKFMVEVNMMKKVIQKLDNGLNYMRIFGINVKLLKLENIKMEIGQEDGIFYLKITFWVEEFMNLVLKLVNGQICIKIFKIVAKQYKKENIKMELDMVNGKHYLENIQMKNLKQCFLCYKISFSGLETYDQEQGINKVDLHRNFNLWCQVISKGVFKQDKRYGNWDILYRYSSKHQFETIGGGLYDMKNGEKNGKWIELHEHFKTDLCEIIYLGEYIDGRKAGRWNIKFRVDSDQDFETIGGGLYDDLNGQKIGEWIDLHENYDRDWCQIKYKGIYKNGIKNGKWDIHFRVAVDEEFIVIGGGHYNGNNGLKQGEWLDLHPNFSCHNQIMLKGQYQNGECQGNFTELKLE